MANPSVPCASLYVGDLHPEVTEAILYERFQTHGNVLSIRVCRDLVTRKSLGYAYVNFQSSNEAKNAMENLNFDDIHGRPCRIMWSQRDPATRRSGVANIFIKNLDPSITVKELYDTFSMFGEITSCKLQYDDNGASKGFAFVNFSEKEDANKAIQAINGKIIRDKIVYVANFVPRNQRTTASRDFTNCYVKNFSTHLDEDGLRNLFGEYGEILSAKVMVDQHGQSKGFGFVSFKEHENAVKAVNVLNGHVVQDKTIYVGRAMKKNERVRELKSRYEKTRQERLQQHKSGVNLYIKNLGTDITDDRLRQEFAVFGSITSAKVMINRDNNMSKGFGFVCFSAPDEATRAVSEMNGKIVDGKPLYVALAQKKEDRAVHLQSQFQQRMHPSQPAYMHPNQFNFMMTGQSQRPFMSQRQPVAMPPRWPINMYPQARTHNMMQLPSQPPQSMMQQRMPQSYRNVIMDPIKSARPITGNLHLSQGKPPYSIVAGARPYGSEKEAVQLDLNTASKIANADTSDAKQLLGEKLYPLVCKHAGDMAGKITGMFLELDNADLLYMIENEESLKLKIEEAVTVLTVHKAEP